MQTGVLDPGDLETVDMTANELLKMRRSQLCRF